MSYGQQEEYQEDKKESSEPQMPLIPGRIGQALARHFALYDDLLATPADLKLPRRVDL